MNRTLAASLTLWHRKLDSLRLQVPELLPRQRPRAWWHQDLRGTGSVDLTEAITYPRDRHNNPEAWVSNKFQAAAIPSRPNRTDAEWNLKDTSGSFYLLPPPVWQGQGLPRTLPQASTSLYPSHTPVWSLPRRALSVKRSNNIDPYTRPRHLSASVLVSHPPPHSPSQSTP